MLSQADNFDKNNCSSSLFSRFVVAGFFLLLFLTFFYRMQKYVFIPFSASSRFGLYLVLFVSVFLIQKNYRRLSPWFFVLAGMVFITGAHTWWQTGMAVALPATSRFGNVLFLAPLAAVLLRREEDLSHVFRLLGLIAVCAYATLLYQHFGGRMESLVQGYIAIRGDLVRHMTLVGEPNVGGMLAVLALCTSILLIRSRGLAVVAGGGAVSWVFFSISKAALIGLAISIVCCIVVSRSNRREIFLRLALGCLVGYLLLLLLGAGDYGKITVDSVIGSIRGEPSALDDFGNRQGHVDVMRPSISLSYLWNYLFGASFGAVGSAAQEVLGTDAGVILPHNSYIELFLTGGGTMLAIVLFMMLRAFLALLPCLWLPGGRPVEKCGLVCLVLLASWMLVYPIIYEPVTGCLFWIIIGYGNRLRIGNGNGNGNGNFYGLLELKGEKN